MHARALGDREAFLRRLWLQVDIFIALHLIARAPPRASRSPCLGVFHLPSGQALSPFISPLRSDTERVGCFTHESPQALKPSSHLHLYLFIQQTLSSKVRKRTARAARPATLVFRQAAQIRLFIYFT